MSPEEKKTLFEALINKHQITKAEFIRGPITKAVQEVYWEYTTYSYFTSDVESNLPIFGCTKDRISSIRYKK